jgi:hypothetical protein
LECLTRMAAAPTGQHFKRTRADRAG